MESWKQEGKGEDDFSILANLLDNIYIYISKPYAKQTTTNTKQIKDTKNMNIYGKQDYLLYLKHRNIES